MRVKRNRSLTEICVFVGCFLLVFISIAQILVFSHRAKNSEPARTMVGRETAADVLNSGTKKAPSSSQRAMPPGASSRVRNRVRAQQEVRELEKALAKLMRESSMTPEEANAKLQTELYARRVEKLIHRADQGRVVLFKTNGSWTGQQVSNHTASPVPYKQGIPFAFERSTANTDQEMAHDGIVRERKSRPLKHFKELDKAEEDAMKSLLARDNVNVSREYEDNYYKVKQQFKDGTELFVDEEALKSSNPARLDICPKEPSSLVGNTTDVNLNISVDFEASVKEHSDVLPGGEWRPSSCISRHRVAIIIPYRDRWNHLKVLLHYLLPTLKRQQIHFRIFVVEQFGNETFNKGRIMNAAFREALQLFDFQCVTFHDVDLVPEDDRNMYSCTEQPKHMSISIDKFQYTLPYQGLVGGVLMFRTDHFQLVNGYSNMYWGWGAEDDDMTTRILHRGLRIYRPPSNIARYKMVKHEGRKTSEVAVRMKLLRSAARRSKMEGLNNVQYKLLSTQTRELFTHFIVDIGHP